MTDTNAIFNEIMAQAAGKQTGPEDIGTQVRKLMAFTEAMDGALMNMSQGLSALGQGLDMCNFKIHMILEVLMDKGVVTEEELNGHYKQRVTDQFNEMRKIHEAKMQEEIAKQEAEAGIQSRGPIIEATAVPVEKVPEEKDEEYTGDVVLASERAKAK
jgi:hypothetical protein